MTAIVITKFGGMAPSANPKSMDSALAVDSHNLNSRFGDFRPFPAAAPLGTASAGVTLYKFNTNSTFLTSAQDVDYVRGPITNDTTERTYYTGDGLPKVTDITNAVRQLGVPRSTTAPTVTINEVDEFTPEDVATWIPQWQKQLLDTVNAHIYQFHVDLQSMPGFRATSVAHEYEFVIPGTMVNSQFVPTNAAHYNLMDARFGFRVETVVVNAVTTVQGIVPMTMRGRVFNIAPGLATALAALVDPSKGTPLLDVDLRETVVSRLTEMWRPLHETHEIYHTGALRTLKDQFIALANSTQALADARQAQRRAFYARADIQQEILNARRSAANQLIAMYNTAATAPPQWTSGSTWEGT